MQPVRSIKKWRIRRAMGLFATKKAIDSLSLRLTELSSEVQDLKTARKRLELEWEELYDKVRHQMSRMSKRAGAADKLLQENPELDSSDSQFPKLDPVSRSIMLRRGMSGGR